ncbi:CDP-glycerol glycerophosphotransferase family protein [Polynucleobacter necessarius]|uniref:CDP-glycerol glycerophosphotransferase family protein n=1 Tax=Polynucleobacter necessarius TaxID=576610 RepID=UPI000E09C73A|nr:CDP-glycerol glycerophosphotransferase family protein [Polynucleobacter necessarius]HAT39081.1 hypothetical protein [Polynucleobacter sp.]
MKGLNTFEKSLHRSAKLVKEWGDYQLPNGRSLRGLLTIKSLSIWDVLAVELALYLVPDSLAGRVKRRTLRQVLTPYLRPIKYSFWKPSELSFKDCKRWPSGRTALFLGFSDYLARDIFHPIISLMTKEGHITPILLSDNPDMHPGVKHIHSMHHHRTQSCIDESIDFHKSLAKATYQLVSSEEYRSIFSENGIFLWKQLKHSIKRAFRVHASFILPDIIAVASHLLREHKPSVIISIDTADPRTRIYSLIGKSLGIPVVQIQSGAVGPEATEWNFFLDDLVMAQGDQSRRYFIAHGVSENKIKVTGSTRYDGLVTATQAEISKLKSRFNIEKNAILVLLASSYSSEIFENNLAKTTELLIKMKRDIFSCLSKFPELVLIVKPHPIEDVQATKLLAKGIKNIIFADAKEDIRPLICACNAFITFGSTSTLDGIILEKPTICPAYPGWIISDNFIKTGSVPAPSSEDELNILIQEIIFDSGKSIIQRHSENRNKFLDDVVLDNGNGATRKIVESLYRISEH